VARKLADVAKQAGVSEATVSRVLNGRPGISEATRAAVLTALDVIGYERPTHLRVRRARMVGLIVPELQNPVFPAASTRRPTPPTGITSACCNCACPWCS
jgi:LacI family transcriptional regulator, repressor for deo operon, udp, cdd, tsx, nupC, and nupG